MTIIDKGQKIFSVELKLPYITLDGIEDKLKRWLKSIKAVKVESTVNGVNALHYKASTLPYADPAYWVKSIELNWRKYKGNVLLNVDITYIGNQRVFIHLDRWWFYLIEEIKELFEINIKESDFVYYKKDLPKMKRYFINNSKYQILFFIIFTAIGSSMLLDTSMELPIRIIYGIFFLFAILGLWYNYYRDYHRMVKRIKKYTIR